MARKDVVYPDIPLDQWGSIYRGGELNIQKTEILLTGGAPIDERTGKILIKEHQVFTGTEVPSSSQYPALFKSEDFFQRGSKERGDVPDSVVSAESQSYKDNIYNPYEDVYNPNDLSVYSRYMFSDEAFDERLPIFKHREQILQRIETYPVVVVEGETGCGKSTQLPQFILHDAAQRGRFCNVVVTQPRRIAAISLHRQVCNSNKWPDKTPGICGYQIGLDRSGRSDDTRLLYCTTGVVLRKLMSILRSDRKKGNGNFTHIILDEVHERDREMDLLLLLVKKYRMEFPTVKVVIMSATIQTEKMAAYFANQGPNQQLFNAPIYKIPGRCYEVEKFYLDDIFRDNLLTGFQRPRMNIDDALLHEDCVKICVKMIDLFSRIEKQGSMGAVLIFVPGMNEIRIVKNALDCVANAHVIPLHSEISLTEQRKAFFPAPEGFRKVIISTNIAESSITVPDCQYVIDFGLNKILYSDEKSSNLDSLRLCWASKANCQQRAGRAGRVSSGRCYRLFFKQMYANFEEFPKPEILRASLCQTVLLIKKLDMGSPRHLLANAIDPPDQLRINRAVLMCKEVFALTNLPMPYDERATPEQQEAALEENAYDGQLTFAGEVLADLPVDVRLGKLILIGHMLGILEDCVGIAACLTTKTFFVRRLGKEFEYHRNKIMYSQRSKSDPIASWHAYRSLCHKREIPRNSGIDNARFQEVRALIADLSQRLTRFGFDFRDWTENLNREDRHLRAYYKTDLIRFALGVAFYPNIFVSASTLTEEMVKRELSGRNHLRTLQVSGLPQNIGFYYHDQVCEIFRKCLHEPNQDFRVFYEQSKAYVEFIDPGAPETAVSACLYLAMRMRYLRRETMSSIRAYNPTTLQVLSEELFNEGREFYRRRGILPSLIMMTYENPRRMLRRPPQQSSSAVSMMDTERSSEFALPESAVCAKVEITHVVSACQFFAQFVSANDSSTQQDFSVLRQTLNEQLTTANIANLEIGTFYVALYPDFGYQRVKLVNLNLETITATVYFVDIGFHLDIDVRRASLYECPSSLTKIRYQAVPCRLAGVEDVQNKMAAQQGKEKLQLNQFESNDNGDRRLKQFDAEIYSIIGSTVCLTLLAKNRKSGASFSVNEWLVSKGLALITEESPESQNDYNQRRRNVPTGLQDYWALRFSDLKLPEEDTSNRSFDLRITAQPTDLSWSSPVYGYGEHAITKVALDSVNAVALNEDPSVPTPYLLTAASVTKDDRTGNLSLMDTTIYPLIPGLAPLMAMVSAPSVELIGPGQRLRMMTKSNAPIGVFCGLGADREGNALFSEHDLYLPLDITLCEQDFLIVNQIRGIINKMVDRKNPLLNQPNSVLFRREQQCLITLVVRLLTQKRESTDPHYPEMRYAKWNLANALQKSDESVLQEISRRMQDGNGVSGDNAFQDRAAASSSMSVISSVDNIPQELTDPIAIEANLQALKRLTVDDSGVDFESVRCLACGGQEIKSLRDLRVHLVTRKHTNIVSDFLARRNAETTGDRETQLRMVRNPDPGSSQIQQGTMPAYFHHSADGPVDWSR